MELIVSPYKFADVDPSEERIGLGGYNTSEALKHRIREVIFRHMQMGWSLVSIMSQGAVICLRFKQQTGDEAGPSEGIACDRDSPLGEG